MHMKEDHMRNGQLKPGYNVNVATSEEFIIGNYISADRNDVHTLIPFTKYLRRYNKIKQICADSGYESEENYCYFEELKDIALFVKPSNHEQRKTKKYRTDISRRENMEYNAETDTYTCANGKAITFDGIMEKPSGSVAYSWHSLDGFSHFRWQLCFVKPCFPQSTPIQRGAASQ